MGCVAGVLLWVIQSWQLTGTPMNAALLRTGSYSARFMKSETYELDWIEMIDDLAVYGINLAFG